MHRPGSSSSRSQRRFAGFRRLLLPTVIIGLLLGSARPAAANDEAGDDDGPSLQEAFDSEPVISTRAAGREFKQYLQRYPEVAEIYEEERLRDSVNITTLSAVLSLVAGGAALAVAAFSGSWGAGVSSATVAFASAYNHYRNRKNKIKKATGRTLNRATDLAKQDPRIEPPRTARFLKAGFVREGDIGNIGRLRRAGAAPPGRFSPKRLLRRGRR